MQPCPHDLLNAVSSVVHRIDLAMSPMPCAASLGLMLGASCSNKFYDKFLFIIGIMEDVVGW